MQSLEIADACLDSTFAQNAVSVTTFGNLPKISPPSNQTDIASDTHVSAPRDSSFSSILVQLWTSFVSWPSFGRLTDIFTFLTFLLAVFTLFEFRSNHKSFNGLTNSERDCGPAIRECFQTHLSKVSETDLIDNIIKKLGRNKQVAGETVKVYVQRGFLTCSGNKQYQPTVSRLTNACYLFHLWR